MPDLSVHAVQWCSQHGHPVLALRTSDARAFIVAMTTDDATAFATTPNASDASRTPRRLHRLVEALVAAISAKLSAVHLHVGSDDVLRASLEIDGPQGEIMLPAHFADGVALAHRNQIPLRISAQDLARVPLTRLSEAEVDSPLSSPGLPPVSTERSAPPPAFQALIESLELDDFGPAQESA
jgi:bifunctional DNase/RNase